MTGTRRARLSPGGGRPTAGEKGRPGPRHLILPDGPVVALAYMALSIGVLHRLWAHLSSFLPFGGDEMNFAWLLRWTPWAVLHGHNPFYSNYLNFPYGVNLLANPGVAALGVAAAPLSALAGPITVYNLVLSLCPAASAMGAYVLARRWIDWRPAAFMAGLIFGFCPYQMAGQFGELNLTFVVLLPLLFAALHELLVTQRLPPRRVGVAVGVLAAAQFFISTELLLDTAIVAGSLVAVAALAAPRAAARRAAHAARGAAWAAGVAAAVLAYPLWVVFAGPAHIAGRVQVIPQAYRDTLVDPLRPSVRQWISPTRLPAPLSGLPHGPAGNSAYLGVPILLAAALAVVVMWDRPIVRALAAGGTVAFVLSLGASLTVRATPDATAHGFPLPGRILASLPVFDNIVPGRFSLFFVLAAAVLTGVALEHLRARVASLRGGRRTRIGTGAAAVVAAACVLPIVPAMAADAGPTVFGPAGTPAAFRGAPIRAIGPGATVLVYPLDSQYIPYATLWQVVADFRFRQPGSNFLVPAAGGRVAVDPITGSDRASATTQTLVALERGLPTPQTPAVRTAVLAELAAWKVHTVVAVTDLSVDPQRARAYLSWLLGPPRATAGGAEWWTTPLSVSRPTGAGPAAGEPTTGPAPPAG